MNVENARLILIALCMLVGLVLYALGFICGAMWRALYREGEREREATRGEHWGRITAVEERPRTHARD